MRPSLLTLLVVFTSGCAARSALVPAPEARLLPDRDEVAVAQDAQVRVMANASAWRGFPRSLTTVVPVKLRIENDSPHPLRLRFEDFALQMQQGVRLSALPPIKLQGSEVVPGGVYGGSGYAVSPLFTHRYFRVARPYDWYYPGLYSWSGPWAYDPFYYDRHYAYWPVELPTPDMVAQALPEGVLEPGGFVDGFIYFQNLPGKEQRATLRAELVNAETGEKFGELSVPFLYRGS